MNAITETRNKPWGEHVKANRKRCGITRRELANRSGINASYITLIERDGYVPRKHVVEAIAIALEGPIDCFLLSAGFASEGIARVYNDRAAGNVLAITLATPLRRLVSQMAQMSDSKQSCLAKAIKGLLEVANG